MKVKINGFEGIRDVYCIYWHERDQVEIAHYLVQFNDHDAGLGVALESNCEIVDDRLDGMVLSKLPSGSKCIIYPALTDWNLYDHIMEWESGFLNNLFVRINASSKRKEKINKTLIDQDFRDPQRPYEHLQPIVDFLAACGNQIVNDPSGFYPTQGGWVCDFRYPIDYELVKEAFVLPPTVHFGQKVNAILCDRSWAEIRGDVG